MTRARQRRVEAEQMPKNRSDQQFPAENSAKWKQMWGQAAKPFKAPRWQNLKQPPISKPT